MPKKDTDEESESHAQGQKNPQKHVHINEDKNIRYTTYAKLGSPFARGVDEEKVSELEYDRRSIKKRDITPRGFQDGFERIKDPVYEHLTEAIQGFLKDPSEVEKPLIPLIQSSFFRLFRAGRPDVIEKAESYFNHVQDTLRGKSDNEQKLFQKLKKRLLLILRNKHDFAVKAQTVKADKRRIMTEQGTVTEQQVTPPRGRSPLVVKDLEATDVPQARPIIRASDKKDAKLEGKKKRPGIL